MFVLKRIDTESKFRSREDKHDTKQNSAEIQQTEQVQYLNTYGTSQLLTPILRSTSVGGALVEFCKGMDRCWVGFYSGGERLFWR
jgi:hypothetical protein